MFDNIGKKIKVLTKVLVWICVIAFIIVGLACFIRAADAPRGASGTYIGMGFAYLIGGPILSWISGFFMYGFGELVDKTCEIHETIECGNENGIDFVEKQRRAKLDRLLNQGLITEEEYNKAIGRV